MIDKAASVQIMPLIRERAKNAAAITICDLRLPPAFERKNLINEKFPWALHTYRLYRAYSIYIVLYLGRMAHRFIAATMFALRVNPNRSPKVDDAIRVASFVFIFTATNSGIWVRIRVHYSASFWK